MHQVRVGDKVLVTADRTGRNLFYSEVIVTPHPLDNHVASDFQYLVTSSGRSIKLTTDHLLLAGECGCGSDKDFVRDGEMPASSLPAVVCESHSMSLVAAASVKIGQCLLTVAGAEAVVQSRIVHSSSGLYTLVTLDGDLVVVNGIIASPFALNHVVVDSFYNIHRLLYRYSWLLLPRRLLQWDLFRSVTEQLGVIVMRNSC